MTRPPAPTLLQGWGPRVAPIAGASTFHRGQDRYGRYNVAPQSGTVLSFSEVGTYGWLLRFGGDDGTLHYLGHNAEGGLLVPVGTHVDDDPADVNGVRLAVQGMTGLATGVHVHWEVRPGGGNPIDPAIWLNQTRPAITPTPSRKDPEMATLISDQESTRWAVFYAATGAATQLRTAAQVRAFEKITKAHGVPIVRFTGEEFDALELTGTNPIDGLEGLEDLLTDDTETEPAA